MLHRRGWLAAREGVAGYTGARGVLHGWSSWCRQKEETELREGLGEVGGRSEKIEQASEKWWDDKWYNSSAMITEREEYIRRCLNAAANPTTGETERRALLVRQTANWRQYGI